MVIVGKRHIIGYGESLYESGDVFLQSDRVNNIHTPQFKCIEGAQRRIEPRREIET
jgi:hypothetical protein